MASFFFAYSPACDIMTIMNVYEPSNLNVIILAAGKGTRMHSSQPKVLHEIAGMPLVSHVVTTARDLGACEICVVYGHGGQRVPELLKNENLSFAEQEPQLGTGHAVQCAIPQVARTGRTLILYGDVPLIGKNTLQKLLSTGTPFGLLTVHLENPGGYGRIVRDHQGKVFKIVEEKDANPGEREITEVNTGVMVLPTEKLANWLGRLENHNSQGEYYLTDVVAMAVSEGMDISTVHPEHEWEVLGVNNRVQLAELERIHQSRRAAELMQSGVTLADPDRFDLRGSLHCGKDVFIDVNCLFEGEVHLGDEVRIGANCVIRNAVIDRNTIVEPFSYIDGAKIASSCKIGPYARIRPSTILGENAHVGNFVEIKNAEIGTGSKANHLSYIGDATIGSGVNIGAGTITCNYDGAKKHRTVIEDGAFIGSDTQLVAPVTIGRNATIGAGSTITRNAPEGGLTLSRSKQVHIEYWKRPRKD